MATLLDLLWDLVERPDERAEYVRDPAGYVRAHGRADLTAEDVHAALDVVCDLVPADLAAAIEAAKPTAPALTLGSDEAPFDRALLTLSHIVESLDGQPEAGPRPDPEDTVIDPGDVAAEPAADRGQAAEAVPAAEPAEAVPPAAAFDASALEIDGDPLRSHEVLEPVLALADEPPFDPTAILGADNSGSDLADIVPLSWDDVPPAEAESAESPDVGGVVGEHATEAEPALEPPAPTPVPEGGFGTGRRDAPADEAEASARDDGDDAPEDPPTTSRTNLFTKKSGVKLPTLGINASDWYDEDESE